MDRTQVRELLVMLSTDPELRTLFRKISEESLREVVAEPLLRRATSKRRNMDVPPGMWTTEMASRMSGIAPAMIIKYIYRGAFQGGDGLVHKAEFCDYVMERCQRKARMTLQHNLELMAKAAAGDQVLPFEPGELFSEPPIEITGEEEQSQQPLAWPEMLAEERTFPAGTWSFQFAARMTSASLSSTMKYIKKGFVNANDEYLDRAQFVKAVMERARAPRRRALHDHLQQLEAVRAKAEEHQPEELAMAS